MAGEQNSSSPSVVVSGRTKYLQTANMTQVNQQFLSLTYIPGASDVMSTVVYSVIVVDSNVSFSGAGASRSPSLTPRHIRAP